MTDWPPPMLSILSLAQSARLRSVSLEVARRARLAFLSVRDPVRARELMRAGGVALALFDRIDPSYVAEVRGVGFRAPLICVAEDDRAPELLRAGASDVLGSQLRRETLISRIVARAQCEPRPGLSYGSLELEPAVPRVRVRGRSVSLTPAEHALLILLLARRGGIVTQAEILSAAVGSNGPDCNVYFHVSNLKKKLGLAAESIENVRGEGYFLGGSEV